MTDMKAAVERGSVCDKSRQTPENPLDSVGPTVQVVTPAAFSYTRRHDFLSNSCIRYSEISYLASSAK